MTHPWELPHFSLPHQALPLGGSWWRGPAASSPECEEALDSLGIRSGAPIPDGSQRFLPCGDLGWLPELAAGPADDPWCRAHWIAGRIRAARQACARPWAEPEFMAVLNLTPDSFSDGGELLAPGAVRAAAAARSAEGASWIDLGAESTRPGAQPVAAQSQLERLLPAIAELRRESPLRISVDTRSATVAEACLAAGASLVNDVSALSDPGMARVVASAGCELCLMHMRGTPATMMHESGYRYLLGAVMDELSARIATALESGIAPQRLLVDPGIGFAKDARASLAMLGQVGALRATGLRVLVGPSRKSFLETPLGPRPPHQREAGTAGAAALCATQGVDLIRLHQGIPSWDAVRVASASARAARDAQSSPQELLL